MNFSFRHRHVSSLLLLNLRLKRQAWNDPASYKFTAMGTNGLWSVYFRGRYYIYYNHWDSYPEGLGEILIDQIPADPEQLQRECCAVLPRMRPCSMPSGPIPTTDNISGGFCRLAGGSPRPICRTRSSPGSRAARLRRQRRRVPRLAGRRRSCRDGLPRPPQPDATLMAPAGPERCRFQRGA